MIVAVRIRPLQSQPDDNKKLKDKRAWSLEKSGAMDTLVQNGLTRKVDGKSVFHFDSVFDEDTKTPLVYKSIARGMVKAVLCESVKSSDSLCLLLSCSHSDWYLLQLGSTQRYLPMDKRGVVKHIPCRVTGREVVAKRGLFSWSLPIYFGL